MPEDKALFAFTNACDRTLPSHIPSRVCNCRRLVVIIT